MNIRKDLYKNLSLLLFKLASVVIGLYMLLGFSGCEFASREKTPEVVWDSLTVTASAYNSLRSQTDSLRPDISAWGDTLKPGMKVIAVSRDLIAKGLDYNTPVKIEGMEGVYLVKDKMHPRWKNKIDIYMGVDVKRARKWGRKKVDILYLPEGDSIE